MIPTDFNTLKTLHQYRELQSKGQNCRLRVTHLGGLEIVIVTKLEIIADSILYKIRFQSTYAYGDFHWTPFRNERLTKHIRSSLKKELTRLESYDPILVSAREALLKLSACGIDPEKKFISTIQRVEKTIIELSTPKAPSKKPMSRLEKLLFQYDKTFTDDDISIFKEVPELTIISESSF